jgi:hypothetical protein
MVYNVHAGARILTIHPEMGMTHQHVLMKPCVPSTRGKILTIYSSYFMCLTPHNENGAEMEDEAEEEHAIEALRVTRGQDVTTKINALVRNPKKRPNKFQKEPAPEGRPRGERLFDVNASKKGHRSYSHTLSQVEGCQERASFYCTPHELRPPAPIRTV